MAAVLNSDNLSLAEPQDQEGVESKKLFMFSSSKGVRPSHISPSGHIATVLRAHP